MKIFSLLAEPTFSNKLEFEYSMTAISRRERDFSKAYFTLALVAPLFLLALWSSGLIGRDEFYFVGAGQLLQAMVALYFLTANHTTNAMRFAVLYLLIFSQIIWTIGARVSIQDGVASQWFAGLWLVNIFFGGLVFSF